MKFNLPEFSQSKTFHGILIGIGFLVILLLTFQAGILVGYHKAGFSGRLGENYYRALGGERDRSPMGMMRSGLPGGHGAVGKIIKITGSTLVIETPDNIEKTIQVGSTTIIRRFHDQISLADLKPNDFAVIIGTPNDQAEIVAALIRLVPPPPNNFSTSTIK